METIRSTILIADDMDINRDMLAEFFSDEYLIIEASDGLEAVKKIKKYKESLVAVLLDLVMPGKDGIEVLDELKKFNIIGQFPILVLTSDESATSERECFKHGATDFIHKPLDKEVVKTRVGNLIDLYLYKSHLENTVSEQNRVIKKRNNDMLYLLGNLVETRDIESGCHVQRVKKYTEIIAVRLMEKYPKYNLSPGDVNVIVEASPLHDIGKISIPDKILLKPGKLDKEEFDEMKTHTTKGGELLKRMKNMWDEEYGLVSYNICMYHHERYDGSGYPEGLKGDEIPIAPQIVSIADVYDALTSKRCYKDSYDKVKAFNMILDGECGAINPDILDCFIDKISEMEECV